VVQEISWSSGQDRSAELPPVEGVLLAVAESQISRQDRPDVLVASLAPGTTIAGSVTRSQTPSAAVEWCRRNLPGGEARVIVVNSGNANAFTGRMGEAAVSAIGSAAAELFDCSESTVYQASTGVIGAPLPHERLIAALPQARQTLAPRGWDQAASAIMTDDRFPKLATRKARIGDRTVTLNGIAKGSGVVAPDMATMLAFLFTDAAIPAPVLRQLLGRSVEQSFNCITVDSETSTSDTALFTATGQAGNDPVFSVGDRRLNEFREALDDLTVDLAKQVVCDGEGAKKFITINVSGAANPRAARKIGLSVANSSAVKTGATESLLDWSRLLVAVGRSGERADRDRLSIAVGGAIVAEQGQLSGSGKLEALDVLARSQTLEINIDVGVGNGVCTVWTCDVNRRSGDRSQDRSF
jgi:glutamate N-acetyltransferase/amino-acid N-acetyltransferase